MRNWILFLTLLLVCIVMASSCNYGPATSEKKYDPNSPLNFSVQETNRMVRYENEEVICYWRKIGYGAGLACHWKREEDYDE